MFTTVEGIKKQLQGLYKVTLKVETTNAPSFSCQTTVKGLSSILLMFCKPQYSYSMSFLTPDILCLKRTLKQ